MAGRSDWILTLGAPMVAEIESAVSAVAARGVGLFDVTRDDFPLPGMGGHFETMLGALEGGRGFVLLRGLPVARWSEAANRVALWGLGTHLGRPVGQDLAGNLLHDVRDVGRKFGSDDSIRYYQTSHAIRLHTDGGDVFALGCVRQGAGRREEPGGERGRGLQRDRPPPPRPRGRAAGRTSGWTPAASARTAPAARCCRSHLARWPPERPATTRVPLLRATLRGRAAPDRGAARGAGAVPPGHAGSRAWRWSSPSAGRRAAREQPHHHARRTGFEDAPDPARRRHLLRLWLTIPNGRPLPPHYADTREYAQTYRQRMPA